VADDVRAHLAALIGDVEVDGLRRLSGGASRETWSFDAVGPDDRRPLILQRDRPGGSPKAGMPVQARLLRAAAGAGVPVPAVLAADERAVVVERLEGETIARKILRDDEYAAARPVLVAQVGRAVARVHAMSVADFPELEELDQLATWREILDATGQAHPAFELGFRWLQANRPPSERRTLVHGDFRLGNLVVGPDGLRAILDWELAHVGDPVEDLSWLCVKAWRFGAGPPVAGLGSYEELLAAYAAECGVVVDPEVLRWWEVLGTLKWGVMCILQASAHLTGAVRSVELAAIGRRVCENEHDLLVLLP